MQRTIPIIGIVVILILSGIPTILSFDSYNINQFENNDNIDWWSMYHHDLQNTGYSTSDAPNTNNILWNFTIAVNDNGYTNEPIVDNGKLYFTSSTNRIYCLDSSNGKLIWSKIIGNMTSYYLDSGPVDSVPAIYNNNLFVCGLDGKIYCINVSSGGIIWSSISLDFTDFPPKIYDGKIYVGSNKHFLYCLSASNGAIIWSSQIDIMYSSPALFDEKVYVCSKKGNLCCLDAISGEQIWITNIGGSITYRASPVIYDNKVYMTDEESYWGGYINCLDAYNGTLLWRDKVYAQGMGHPSPTVADGKVYLGSSGGSLYCINAEDGSGIWYREFGGPTSSPAIADGKVYFGTGAYFGIDKCSITGNSNIRCLNADNGSFIWSYPISIYMEDIPTIADGKLYCNRGSKIYCFGDDIPPKVDIVSPKKDSLCFFGKNIPFILSVIFGSINIEINASDNESGLDFIELYIDNNLTATIDTISKNGYYEWNWTERIPLFDNHIFTIKVIANDYASNQASDEIKVWKFF